MAAAEEHWSGTTSGTQNRISAPPTSGQVLRATGELEEVICQIIVFIRAKVWQVDFGPDSFDIRTLAINQGEVSGSTQAEFQKHIAELLLPPISSDLCDRLSAVAPALDNDTLHFPASLLGHPLCLLVDDP
jgi:hypothetical protein